MTAPLEVLRQIYAAVTDTYVTPVEDQQAARGRLGAAHQQAELCLGAHDGTLNDLGRALLAPAKETDR